MGSPADLRATFAAVDASLPGPETAAYFHADGVLIAGDLVRGAAAAQQRRGGLAGVRRMLPLPAGRGADGDRLASLLGGWRGCEESDVADLGRRLFVRKVADLVYAEARELVAAHRRRGHTVVVTSSAPRHLVEPLADALDIDQVLCSRVEVVDGHLTGELVGPPCAGAALAAAVEEQAEASGVDLSRSHAYASSADAVALLSRVGVAHPTNPDEALARIAERDGWPVLRFNSRGPAGAEAIARSLAGYGTMVPSLLGGVAVGILNRNREQVAGYGVSSWIERLFAITGVTLDVQGEEHLWSSRPAVFIYNHRNNFDPYVAIRLVRRDWGSVAKKEIAGPLAGPMQWLLPNVAFIDRSDPDKAVEGLAPVTELLRSGTSVLVAPEGTRSRTGRLGPFKKGPFRMAMEAGVPIVPIVIRNADRVANREAGIIRKGTIDVTVLPPVDVSEWTSEDLDDRIAEVRERFVDTLTHWPERRPSQRTSTSTE